MNDERVIELWITAPRGGRFGVSGYPMVVRRFADLVAAETRDELAAGYASRDVGEKVSDKEIERLVRKAGLLELIDDACLNDACTSICDWLPALHEFAELVQSAEHERCAKYLRDAAARLAPEGKRINQIDRHVANVLACKGDELAAGYACRDSAEGEKK